MIDRAALLVEHAALPEREFRTLRLRLTRECSEDSDYLQEARIALMKAARNFELDGGASFRTYAKACIRGALLDYSRQLRWGKRNATRGIKQIADDSMLDEIPARMREVGVLDLTVRSVYLHGRKKRVQQAACEHCGDPFDRIVSEPERFCRLKCFYAHRRRRACACGRLFVVPSGRGRSRKWCPACLKSSAWHVGGIDKRRCRCCGRRFNVKRSAPQRFCSLSCAGKRNRLVGATA